MLNILRSVLFYSILVLSASTAIASANREEEMEKLRATLASCNVVVEGLPNEHVPLNEIELSHLDLTNNQVLSLWDHAETNGGVLFLGNMWSIKRCVDKDNAEDILNMQRDDGDGSQFIVVPTILQKGPETPGTPIEFDTVRIVYALLNTSTGKFLKILSLFSSKTEEINHDLTMPVDEYTLTGIIED